jgi:hypothetical protein
MKPDRKTTAPLPHVRQVRADDEHANANAEILRAPRVSSGVPVLDILRGVPPHMTAAYPGESDATSGSLILVNMAMSVKT